MASSEIRGYDGRGLDTDPHVTLPADFVTQAAERLGYRSAAELRIYQPELAKAAEAEARARLSQSTEREADHEIYP